MDARDFKGPPTRLCPRGWVSEFAEAIRQDDPGAYVNFLGDQGESRVRAAYRVRPGIGSSR